MSCNTSGKFHLIALPPSRGFSHGTLVLDGTLVFSHGTLVLDGTLVFSHGTLVLEFKMSLVI